MVLNKNISKERVKIILIIFFIFLSLGVFYKWQILTSSSYLLLGNKNYNKENYNEALKNYKYTTIIKGDRDTVYKARIKRAKIFYESGELEKAKQEIYKSIKEKKSDNQAYEIMGDIYYAERNIDSAMLYYKKAKQIKKTKELEVKLGKIFIAKNDNKKAYNIFSQLLLEYDDSEILYYLGLLSFYDNTKYNNFFQQCEKNSEYKDELREIKRFSINYADIKNEKYKNVLIADLYNKINQPYLAINKIKENSRNTINYRDAWIVLGKSNFILGNYKIASDNFQKALALDSHNQEILFWLENPLNNK